MKKQNKIVIGVIALVAIIIGMVVLAYNFMPSTQQGEKSITIEVVANETTTEFEINTSREFLGEALVDEGLVEGETSEYGLFITVVNGIEADASLQQWWSISKDGEMLMTGADTTPILDGEKYEFTLSTY